MWLPRARARLFYCPLVRYGRILCPFNGFRFSPVTLLYFICSFSVFYSISFTQAIDHWFVFGRRFDRLPGFASHQPGFILQEKKKKTTINWKKLNAFQKKKNVTKELLLKIAWDTTHIDHSTDTSSRVFLSWIDIKYTRHGSHFHHSPHTLYIINKNKVKFFAQHAIPGDWWPVTQSFVELNHK